MQVIHLFFCFFFLFWWWEWGRPSTMLFASVWMKCNKDAWKCIIILSLSIYHCLVFGTNKGKETDWFLLKKGGFQGLSKVFGGFHGMVRSWRRTLGEIFPFGVIYLFIGSHLKVYCFCKVMWCSSIALPNKKKMEKVISGHFSGSASISILAK